VDYQNEKSSLKKKSSDRTEIEQVNRKLTTVSLEDMPLENRRKEAEKPLFLIRYE
jgi:hypothetical protein